MMAHERVAGFMVGGHLFVACADDPRFAGRTGYHAVDGLCEVLVEHGGAVVARGEDGGLVDEVRQIGPAEAGRLLGDTLDVDGLVDGLAFHVDLEDGLASAHVRVVEGYPTVEAARPEEGGVEDVGAVGGGEDDDVDAGVEAVHLDEYLVQSLLTLVVSAAETGTTVPADGVDLVDEDDARRVAFGLLEQVANAGSADADEHLDELRAADGEEGHTGLARDGTGKERLACAGRSDEQDASGDARTQVLEAFRESQEIDDLFELFLGLVGSGDILESDARLVADEHPSAAASEAEGLVGAALGLTHHEQEHGAEEDERQEVDEDAEETARPLDPTTTIFGLPLYGSTPASTRMSKMLAVCSIREA